VATVVTTMAIPLRYEHVGGLDWECSACKVEGAIPFEIETSTPEPRAEDYDTLLTAAEVEHALTGCRGRVVMVCARRNKVVEHLDKKRLRR
jgi:hypothetical protein